MKKRAKEFHRELRHAHPVHACAIASSIMDDMISIEEKLRTEFDHMDMQDKASRERQKDIAVRISIGMWDLYGDACSRWPATPRPERWAKMKRR
jgi:hypothetical protein